MNRKTKRFKQQMMAMNGFDEWCGCESRRTMPSGPAAASTFSFNFATNGFEMNIVSDFPLVQRSGTAAMSGVISQKVLVNLSGGSCRLNLHWHSNLTQLQLQYQKSESKFYQCGSTYLLKLYPSSASPYLRWR